jgi:hypothetical protein
MRAFRCSVLLVSTPCARSNLGQNQSLLDRYRAQDFQRSPVDDKTVPLRLPNSRHLPDHWCEASVAMRRLPRTCKIRDYGVKAKQ